MAKTKKKATKKASANPGKSPQARARARAKALPLPVPPELRLSKKTEDQDVKRELVLDLRSRGLTNWAIASESGLPIEQVNRHLAWTREEHKGSIDFDSVQYLRQANRRFDSDRRRVEQTLDAAMAEVEVEKDGQIVRKMARPDLVANLTMTNARIEMARNSVLKDLGYVKRPDADEAPPDIDAAFSVSDIAGGDTTLLVQLAVKMSRARDEVREMKRLEIVEEGE